ncbi:MAG: hypothetical protein IJ629_06765 [Clostridia bacterium]|nr:hypothetical protein [Clostridia bacterium]
MKNRKITTSLLIILSIFIILLMVLPTIKVKATEYSSNWTSTTSSKSYDAVAGIPVETLFSYSWDCDNDEERSHGKIPNFLCLHHGQNSKGDAFKLVGVLDVNADGSDYTGYTWYYRGADGEIKSKPGKSTGAAEIAWISYRAHANVGSKADGTSPQIGISVSKMFIDYWDNSIYKLPTYDVEDLGSVSGWSTKVTKYGQCGDYGESDTGVANGKVVKARILYFSSCWTQDTAMLFGALTDGTKIENDKYITKVNSSNVTPGNRAGKRDSWKRSHLPEVVEGDIITFEIPIKNSGKVKAKDIIFQDQFNTDCFEAVASDYCTISGAKFTEGPTVNGRGQINAKIKEIDVGDTATITVTLKVKENPDLEEDTPYENGARAGSNSYVYDYVKILQEHVLVDKYISGIETLSASSDEEDTPPVIADNRKATTEAEWNEGKNTWKRNNAVQVGSGNIKVTYTIRLKNVGSRAVTGSLTDTPASIFSNLSITPSSYSNITIQPGDDHILTFTATVDGDPDAVDGFYENKAIFTTEKGKKVTSSDWVFIGNNDQPDVKKYITSIDSATFSRSAMTEKEKQSNPANAGMSDATKTISYTVEIYNKNNFAITGTFTDTHDSEIQIISQYSASGSTITNGSEITIEAKSTYKIYITARFSETDVGGVYGNTAQFEYNGTIESSDYFIVEPPEPDTPPDAELKKYISAVDNGNLIRAPRSGMSITDKDGSPVEVVKGSVVTYTIELTNNIWYENKSRTAHCSSLSGECDEDHPEEDKVDWIYCVDTWDEGLEPTGDISGNYGVTFDQSTGRITWYDVPYEERCTAEIKFRVTASDMHLANIKNEVRDVNWQYTWYYGCYPVHETWYTCEHWWGSHEVCSHDACYWEHPTRIVKGTATGEDSDYVRLLDPEVAGDVWDEQTINGLRDSGESIETIIRDDYKNILVKLWKEDNTLVDSKTIDENGHYTFGRVRKGDVKTGGVDKDRDIWSNVPENQEFNYNNATLVSYYITFEYNGERYQATTPSGESQFRETNPNYRVDSNAEEQERQKFNNSLETIAYNVAFGNTEGTNGKPLAYETSLNGNLQESKLIWNGSQIENDTNTTWENNYTDTTGPNRSITMIAKTYNFYVRGTDDEGEIDYLKHIDLGLYQREDDVNLSLTKDVVSADVTVNNHRTNYEYGGVGTGAGSADGSDYTSEHNVQKNPYTLSVYREDYEFRTEKYKNGVDNKVYDTVIENNQFGKAGNDLNVILDNDLNVILTYKITVKNDSTEQKAVVREVIDYASKDLTRIDAKLNDLASGTALTVESSSSYENPTRTSSLCQASFIKGEDTFDKITLEPGESFDIYIRYKVNRNSEGYIILDPADGGINDSKLNIAEIGAYSFYQTDGTTPAGLVDQNSNPGNVEFNEDGTPISYDETNNKGFEDDSFETGIKVLLKDVPPPPTPGPKVEKYYYRNISGIVFEELNPTATSSSDGQLVGDGIMNNSDIPAANVLVKLYEVVRKSDGSEEYYVDTGLWYRTGEDGKYYFGDATEDITSGKPVNATSSRESKDDCYKIHAGLYTVRFIYGDEKDYLVTTDGNLIRYSGQDYQSVKYTDVGNASDESEVVLATAFARKSGNTNPFNSAAEPTLGSTIYSVAKDNEIRRIEVMEYSTTTTYLMDTVLKANNALAKNADGTNANIPLPEETDSMSDKIISDKVKERELLAKHTAMFADTKTFDVDIEYYDNYYEGESSIIPGLTITKENRVMNGKVKTIVNYYYSIRDVNFGLIERPRTKLQLMNDITEVRAITSDGATLLDIFFDVVYEKNTDGTIKHTAVINYNKSRGYEEVQVLNRNIPGNNQGFRYANIDTDLLQGMTITIKFRVAIANISDVDHVAAWLERKLEAENTVELNVTYGDPETPNPKIDYSDGDSKITDKIDREKREYNYAYSYLYNLLYNGDSAKGIRKLKNAQTGEYTYDTVTPVGSEAVRARYTYINITKKAQSDYKPGYYLGNIYYNAVSSGNEAKVQTRVDQFIDYVDNDLIFKPEENKDENDQMQYLTYTTKEISQRGLLKDIIYEEGHNPVTKITDGQKDYYNEKEPNTNNNLAFNIEKEKGRTIYNGEEIVLGVYKFLRPIKDDDYVTINDIEHTIEAKPGESYYDFNRNGTADTTNVKSIGNPYNKSEEEYQKEINKYFYVLDLQASRTLTSEVDLNGVVIDNIAEIVKATNAVGRKVYVYAEGENTGYIGNTTKAPIESVNDLSIPEDERETLVSIAKAELDTDFTEYVTFSPPTGLTEQQSLAKIVAEKTGDVLLILVPVIIIIAGMSYVTVQFVRRKKFYK